MSKPFKGVINVDADGPPSWMEPYVQPVAPAGTPNVLYVVLDDVGFSAMEPWGGLIETPNIKKLAASGLTYELAHDGALLADSVVAPHRRNHTANGMACIAEATTGFPNSNGRIPFGGGDDRRGPRRTRLEHLHAREVAPGRRRRDEHGLDEASASRAQLRALLRIPRRRDEPVVPT